MTHIIKLDIQFCDPVLNGIKTFEVRKNDRDYKKDDLIKFIPVGLCFQHVAHPIENKIYKINYVLTGWGIQEGFCVFGISEVNHEDRKR